MSRTKQFEGICLQAGLNQAIKSDNPEEFFPAGDYFACPNIDCSLAGEVVTTANLFSDNSPTTKHNIYTDGDCAKQ